MFGIDDAFLMAAGASAMSYLGGQQANQQRATQATQANEFSAGQFATRYQTTTKDMMAAGLNPMLAYSQGGGSPPSGQQAQVGDDGTPAAESGYKAFSAGRSAQVQEAQIDNINADSAVKRAQAGLVEAQIGATGASADQSRATIANLEVQSKKMALELENVPKEGNRLVKLANMLEQQAILMDKQHLTEIQKASHLEALARKTIADAGLSELDLKAANDMGNIGREAGQLKPIFDILRGILRR